MMTPPLEPFDPGRLLRMADHYDIEAKAGACAQPVTLTGTRMIVEEGTGRVLHRLDATDLAGQRLRLRCRNRRVAVCPACSALYKLDAYHLISAGLSGGKSINPDIATHPRLLLTLTAPSFGKVHTGPGRAGIARACHKDCGATHLEGDPLTGTALHPAVYDYAGQVLFNAHAGALRAAFATQTRRNLAAFAGLSRREAARQVRVVFAKVAEFQARGCIHFHAIVRLDGTGGANEPPPGWASIRLLRKAIRASARTITVTTPASRHSRARLLRWGRQIDMQPIGGNDNGLPDTTVARYIAKYTTKGTEAVGLTLRPVCCRTCHGKGTIAGIKFCRDCGGSGRRRGVDLSGLPSHTRALVEACWRLGGQPELKHLRLRQFAHQLGYRGHVCTKSRTYSTTFAALRAERRDWTDAQLARRLGIPEAMPVVIVNDWRYLGRASATEPHTERSG